MVWVDGRIVPADGPVIRSDDSAYREGRGCYTTARIAGGRARFARRHAARLTDGVRELELGSLEEAQVLAALDELARAAFPDGEGIVRLQASRDSTGLRLIGTSREVGADRAPFAHWTATLFELPHPGAAPVGWLKVTNRLVLALAAQTATRAGVDEALLLDSERNLVEGTRSNLIAVLGDGTLATPPLRSGALAGIARAVCMERIPEICERDIPIDDRTAIRELIAVNAVRGARSIVSIDGEAVGDGTGGPIGRRLSDVLAAE